MQFRTILTTDATSQLVQEPDGTLSHDALFPDRPWETTPLVERDVADIRALLYHEKATEEERAKCLPVARSLAEGKVPDARDTAAVGDAKASADARPIFGIVDMEI